MIKSSKGFAHILLILVVVVIAIGGVGYLMYQNVQLGNRGSTQQKPSQNNTGDISSTTSFPLSAWVSLSSKNFKISLKYPPDWRHTNNAEISDIGLPYVTRFSPDNETVWSNNGCAFQAAFAGHIPSLDDYTDETITIDNKPFKKRTWTENGKPAFVEYIPNSRILNFDMILAWISQTDQNGCQQTIDQILSTLEVSNENVVSNTRSNRKFLKNYKGFDYYLEWESLENPVTAQEYKFNLVSPVILAEHSSNEKINTYDLDYFLGFEDGDPRFSVIPIIDSTNEVYFLQPCNGAGCTHFQLINLDSKIIRPAYRNDDYNGYFCGSGSFYNHNVIVCKKDENGVENLYHYDYINTGKVILLTNISGTETFKCKSQNPGFDYEYLDNSGNIVEVKICDKDQNELRTMKFDFRDY